MRPLLLLLFCFSGMAWAQQEPVRVPAPVFRVPPGYVLVANPGYSSSATYYEPPYFEPSQYGPVYPAAPRVVRGRGYSPRRNPWDGGEPGLGIFGGVLITLALILLFAVPH